MDAYAELQVTTNFSFLRGASHPEELVAQAVALGLKAIAITDHNSLAGIVRAHVAVKRHNETAKAGGEIRLVVGARLDLMPPDRDQDQTDSASIARSILCFPTNRAAYGRLSRLISLGQRRAEKGGCRIGLDDLLDHGEGLIVIALPPDRLDPGFSDFVRRLRQGFRERCHLAAHFLYRGDDVCRIDALARLGADLGIPLVATNDVRYHLPARRRLLDVLCCIREHCTIDRAGFRLLANAERHLKSPAEMSRLFRAYPDMIRHGVEIARACRFSLDELRYDYPIDAISGGLSPQEHLEALVAEGARERYPRGIPPKVQAGIDHELALIAELRYAPYFLTVHDIVRFARSNGILCQGRGSAANSAICYCLGITAVDPEHFDLLFERFISTERNEPPDIDVDFEHERREEVIQYVYRKYGRDHAGIAATVVHYRNRRAIREVGKAFGLSDDVLSTLTGSTWGSGNNAVNGTMARRQGLDPNERRLGLVLELAEELIGFPRHLSQHVGGFVLTKNRLDHVVPISNAAMEDRTVVEWDKDDLDALGILKIDILALGMLTCIRKAFDLLDQHDHQRLTLATVPGEDEAVYDMLGRADSIGVFQVESRAQMSMLPRLKPKKFYDLVIEVAIVRPGPIQGKMVHPYLRRRQGKEKVVYPSEPLKSVLGKTLGVPLFQEQAMRIAIVAAGFTPAEADRLRRAMATFRRSGTINQFRERFVRGMVGNGYQAEFAERCFRQIEGFGDYGFPESHAISFALLAYVSSWLKCHHPALFACALLNSQPMGFYAPAQIVRDARDHGVTVLPVDVNMSAWDCTLEPCPDDPDQSSPTPASRTGSGPGENQQRPLALRLGFRQVKGLKEAAMRRLVARRGNGYGDLADLRQRAALDARTLDRLARADGFRSMGFERRAAVWSAIGLDRTGHELDRPPLFAWAEGRAAGAEPRVELPAMTLGQAVAEDYSNLRLSLRAHPLALLRPHLGPEVIRNDRLAMVEDGARVEVAGLVLVRQRPGTASGVIFVTLEDESGIANLVVWPTMFERYRRAVLGAQLMLARGRLQKEGLVIHLVVDRLVERNDLLVRLDQAAPSFEAPLARADRVKPSRGRGKSRPRKNETGGRLDEMRAHRPPVPETHGSG